MRVRELGRGSSTVLLLHGAPSPADDLLPLAEHLATRYRVLVPDMPGYGDTPGGGDLSYAATNHRLADMLRSRAISALHGIVGFSGGAFRAFYLLLRSQITAKHVLSIGGLAGHGPSEREQFHGLAAMVRADPSSLTSPALVQMMAERMLSPTWRADHPADAARAAAWLTLTSPADMAAELDAAVLADDLRPLLPTIKARTHVRVGELDQACPVALSQAIASAVPNATLSIVPGAGHALLIEDADATIAWVDAALRDA